MTRISILLTVTFFISFSFYAQIKFEKGYFISNDNIKTACYIKNEDWNKNPTKIFYKLNTVSQTKTMNTAAIKVFEIYNFSKYIKSLVQIDYSSANINDLSYNKSPEWIEKEVMLQVILEGKASLYQYTDKDINRFFFKTKDDNIKQLIHKEYFADKYHNIKTNDSFKQQLVVHLMCENTSISIINTINYYKKSLLRYFKKYNQCFEENSINYESKKKRKLINLHIRPGIESTSAKISNGKSTHREAEFDNKIEFRIGLEVEYILPFNKNKWSIIIEPTYSTYQSEGTSIHGKIATIDYITIGLPIGLQHSMYINDNSKLYINGAINVQYNLNSIVTLDNTKLIIDDAVTTSSFGFGIGYAFKRCSLEIRYQTPNSILNEYIAWESSLKKTSFILGYRIF